MTMNVPSIPYHSEYVWDERAKKNSGMGSRRQWEEESKRGKWQRIAKIPHTWTHCVQFTHIITHASSQHITPPHKRRLLRRKRKISRRYRRSRGEMSWWVFKFGPMEKSKVLWSNISTRLFFSGASIVAEFCKGTNVAQQRGGSGQKRTNKENDQRDRQNMED